MKLQFKKAIPAMALCYLLATHGFAQTCVVTFQADFRGVTVKDPTTIGVRGSQAPLAWDKTLPLQDTDRDGIYSLTVDFANCKPGESVDYKYFHSDSGWENDKFGAFGNRSVTLVDGSQKIPVQKYDQLDKFSNELLLQEADKENFRSAIFIIASAKKRGLGIDAIAREIHDFWKEGDDWLKTPQDWMTAFQFGHEQSASKGKFKTLENKPGHVKFQVAKTWDGYFDQSGVFKGVTKTEMNQIWKKMNELRAADRGWKLNWSESADQIEITITGTADK